MKKEKLIKSEENTKKITTKALARQLGTSVDVVQNCVKRVMPKKMVERKTTYFNEKEVSLILAELKKNTNMQSHVSAEVTSAVKKTTTLTELRTQALSGLQNILKLSLQDQIKATMFLCQKTITKLKDKNEKLELENKEVKDKNEKLKLEKNKEITYKQLWNKIDGMIKDYAKKSNHKVSHIYRMCYDEFIKEHHIEYTKVDKNLFKKSPKYMKELLEIVKVKCL